MRKYAVFAEQRHNIGDRADCRKIGIVQRILQRGQRADQLERYTATREERKRIRAAASLRIDDPGRTRQFFAALVMIGNDHVHAEFFGQLHLGDIRNAAVHRHNQRRSGGRDSPHGVCGKPVALEVPVGRAYIHFRAHAAQMQAERAAAADAVRVVVAEHADLLFFYGLPYARHRLWHIGQQKRVMKLRDIRMQKSLRERRRVHTAPA